MRRIATALVISAALTSGALAQTVNCTSRITDDARTALTVKEGDRFVIDHPVASAAAPLTAKGYELHLRTIRTLGGKTVRQYGLDYIGQCPAWSQAGKLKGNAFVFFYAPNDRHVVFLDYGDPMKSRLEPVYQGILRDRFAPAVQRYVDGDRKQLAVAYVNMLTGFNNALPAYAQLTPPRETPQPKQIPQPPRKEPVQTSGSGLGTVLLVVVLLLLIAGGVAWFIASRAAATSARSGATNSRSRAVNPLMEMKTKAENSLQILVDDAASRMNPTDAAKLRGKLSDLNGKVASGFRALSEFEENGESAIKGNMSVGSLNDLQRRYDDIIRRYVTPAAAVLEELERLVNSASTSSPAAA